MTQTAVKNRASSALVLVLFPASLIVVAALLPNVARAGDDEANAAKQKPEVQKLETSNRVVVQSRMPDAAQEKGQHMQCGIRLRAARTEQDPAQGSPAHVDCNMPDTPEARTDLRILLIPVLDENGSKMTCYRVVSWQEDGDPAHGVRYEPVGAAQELSDTATLVLEPKWQGEGAEPTRPGEEATEDAKGREFSGFVAIAAKLRSGKDPSGEIEKTSKTNPHGMQGSSEGSSGEETDAFVETQRVELPLAAGTDVDNACGVLIRPRWSSDGSRLVGYTIQLVRKSMAADDEAGR